MCIYWLYVVNICKMYGTHSFKINILICKQFDWESFASKVTEIWALSNMYKDLLKSLVPHLHTRSVYLNVTQFIHLKIENTRAVTLWDLVVTFLWRSLLDKYPSLRDMRCNLIAIILGSNVPDWCTNFSKIPHNFVDTKIFLGSDFFI
jgi:hypothetical protein